MIKSGDAANAAALRIVVSQDSVQNVTDGLGARALGDTLYHATYMLKNVSAMIWLPAKWRTVEII